jgi:hypothetical protein
MNQRETKNSVSNAFDPDGGDVAALLIALPRVEAPKDFEFGVRAKIAAGGSPRRAALIPFLKVATPLSLVIAMAGFGIFYSTLPTENPKQVVTSSEGVLPPIAAPRIDAPAATLPETVSSPHIDQPVPVQPQRASVEREITRPARRSTNSSMSVDSSGGGSRVFMLESANTKNPRGLDIIPNSLSHGDNANVAGAQIPVRDVFGMLGLDAELVDGGWKVRSVAENSVASRAKVQAGDIIEAIDGQQLKGNTMPKGTAAVATIRRDGKTISVSLK